MNKLIILALSQQIINYTKSKDKTYILSTFFEKKIIEEELVYKRSIIQEILDLGISPLTVVEDNGKNALLLEHVAEYDFSLEILNLLINKLTKEEVKQLTPKIINNIYEKTDYNIKILEFFFENGFDFQQGEFNEVDKVLNTDIGFFELCLKYKKDFSFLYLYEDNYSLDQILAEDIKDIKKTQQSHNPIYLQQNKDRESLLFFLNQVKKIEQLKNDLSDNLLGKEQESKKNFKI